MRLVSGGCKMSRFLHLPSRILKVYIEASFIHTRGLNWVQLRTQGALTGFSHLPSLDSLITTLLSQGSVLGAAPGSGEGKQSTNSRDGVGVGSLQLPSSSSLANWWSHPLDVLL